MLLCSLDIYAADAEALQDCQRACNQACVSYSPSAWQGSLGNVVTVTTSNPSNPEPAVKYECGTETRVPV